MKFIEGGSKGINTLSSYIFTIVLICLMYGVIGQLPLLIHLVIHQIGVSGVETGDTVGLVNSLGNNTFLFYLLIPFVLSFIALLLAVQFIHKRPFLSVITSRSKFDWKRFLMALSIWGGLMSLFLFISIQTGAAIEWNMKTSTIVPLILISLLIIPIQTACEEVLFRGYLLQAFGNKYKNPWLAIIVTGVLFGLLHGANPEVAKLGVIVMTYYIGTGIFLGIIAHYDNGLELSLGYHAANNIFASLILTNSWQAFQTDALFIDKSPPNFGWDSILTLLILQPLMLFAFSKIYKWKKK